MQVISYIESILDMETPLARKRILGVKGNKALRGEQVKPGIKLTKDPSLDFMSKAILQIRVSLNARKVNMPENKNPSSKYKAKIT